MTGKKLQRVLACLLAVLLLSQVGAFSPAVFAADGGAYTLHDGTAVIPAGTSNEDVNRILAAALVDGFDQMSAGEQKAILDKGFEYQCHFTNGKLQSAKSYWGSVAGGTTKKEGFGKLSVEYTCPALADNSDGNYKVRLAGTEAPEVTLTKAAKLSSSIELNEGVSIVLPYMDATTVDYDALRAAISDRVVQNTTPELTVNDVTIEYYATATTGAVGSLGHNWAPLEGGKISGLTYPAIPAGEQTIRISYAGNDTYGDTSAEVTVNFTERQEAEIHVKAGQEVSLPYTDATTVDYDALRAKLFTAVVENTTPDMTVNDVTIAYYATATTGAVGDLGHAWVALNGGKVSGLTYPAIPVGLQTIRFTFAGDSTHKGTSITTTVMISERPSVKETTKENPTFQLQYADENGTAEPIYDKIKEQVWNAVIEKTDSTLSLDEVTIEYYATATTGAAGDLGKAWVPLTGESGILTYPAISEGTRQVRISWPGNKDYAPWTLETEVEVTGRPEVEVTTKNAPTFKLAFTDNGEAIYDNIQQQVWDAVIASTTPTLTVDNVTIEYYATAESGVVEKWMPLTGGKDGLLTYPAIPEGTQKVRISWAGTKDYAPNHVDATVEVTGRADAPFQLKQGVSEVAIFYNKATAQALREALLESTDPNVSINNVTVQYNPDITGITKNYRPLDCNETLVLVKFGLGNQIIHFSWSGNADYKPLKLDDVTVKMSDNRIESKIVLKDGVSITYHMDPAVMEQEIFENLIDWDASTLPEKSTLSAADFTFEYYGENVLGNAEGGISGGVPNWAPVAGGTVNLLTYPQMGAGENQKVRVSYSGNDEYRSCKNVEGTLTVNKAKVTVKVHTTSIYADEQPGEGFITTDPADKFDIYTIYGGMTSDVTTSVFVQLPERYTNGTFLKIIDGALSAAELPTLTQMMQDGVTVGQLKAVLGKVINTQLPTSVKDVLKQLGIDVDALQKLYNTLNKLPGLMDNVRVAFGTPDQAGLYVVTAVTNNKNYETGVGTGMLLVKKHYSGVKLQWNQTIPNGKLTAEEAANFDFGVTLMYDGKPAEKQTNVHYLYSGFTSKWKPYSSTTTPPTEPGRYVVTVVTLGGNYQAAPITRAFQITK